MLVFQPLSVRASLCSPDGAQRNPGPAFDLAQSPHVASLDAGDEAEKKLRTRAKTHLSSSHSARRGAPSRGVLVVEQAGGGAGEQVLQSGSRRPAIPGLVLGRRPRTRFAPSYSGGVGAPPGDTTIPCREPADRRKCRKARPDAVVRTPPQSVERRAGLRHGPAISGDPEMGPLARRTTGCGASAPAPVGALLPSRFSGSG